MARRCSRTERRIQELEKALVEPASIAAASIRARKLSWNEQALAPAVLWSLQKLRGTSDGASSDILTRPAEKDLSNDLHSRLNLVLKPALDLLRQAHSVTAISLAHSHPNRRKPTSAPRKWRVTKTSLTDLLKAFPGAALTVGLVIDDWINAQREMLLRIQQDREKLRRFFFRCENPLRIIHLRLGASDPHDGGRTVCIVEFQGHRRVVYKPRSCSGERIWFRTLSWINSRGFTERFAIPKLLSRQKYHWMSFISPRPIRNRTAARSFYFRWGAQTALAQFLGATDLHRDNWIASGVQPVLVDAEMMGGDGLVIVKNREVSLGDELLHPILKTGLLPLSDSDGVGIYRGIAPFDITYRKNSPPPCWPRHKGKVCLPSGYVAELADGFIRASRFLCDNSRQDGAVLRQIFESVYRRKQRVLLRATSEYYDKLTESLHPQYLFEKGARLRHLMDILLASAPAREIASTEARTLLRCSIPRISCRISRHPPPTIPTGREIRDSIRLLRHRLKESADLARKRAATHQRA